jgi:Zn-dependent peptidase ImmA (M78 family)/DNA-binding XRE family transcriptional regulator
VNIEALCIAREALGFTQTDLAHETNLAQSDLSRWERGLRTPNRDQVETLAAALKVPTSFLLSDLRFTQPVHRTQRAETKRTERLVSGRLELARVAATRLLADINIDTPFPFPTIEDPLSPDPEEAAEAIRRVWRVPAGPIDDLAGLVEAAGAIVLPVNFGVTNILAAYANLRGDQRWCFTNTQPQDGARARFSLAHELGHAILHWDRFDAPKGRDAEQEAHRFAAAFLMPAADISASLGRIRFTLNELIPFRQRWGVSIQALITRARDLRLISGDQFTRLYKQISARGWRKSEPGLVPLERPALLTAARAVQRQEHGYSEEELAELAGFDLVRLADLLPEHFRLPNAQPRLSVVS